MLSFLGHARVVLAAGATDVRKSFDTLAGVVRNSLQLDPLSGHLFVFANSRRNRLKILLWDRNGWWEALAWCATSSTRLGWGMGFVRRGAAGSAGVRAPGVEFGLASL